MEWVWDIASIYIASHVGNMLKCARSVWESKSKLTSFKVRGRRKIENEWKWKYSWQIASGGKSAWWAGRGKHMHIQCILREYIESSMYIWHEGYWEEIFTLIRLANDSMIVCICTHMCDSLSTNNAKWSSVAFRLWRHDDKYLYPPLFALSHTEDNSGEEICK